MKTKAINQLTSALLAMFVIIMFAFSACSSDDSGDDPVPVEDFNTAVRALSYIVQPAEIDPPEEIATVQEPESEGIYTCNVKRYKAAPGYNELFLMDPTSDVMFPGAMIKGESVSTGAYIPIIADRTPITISTSLENINGSPSRTVENPSLSTIRAAINDILASEVTGSTPAKISFSIEEVHSEEQFNLAVGANYNNPAASVSGSFDFKDETKKSRIVVKFLQVYYTIDVDPKSEPKDFFNNTPNLNIFGSVSPLYVSTITYGRMALFTFESEYSSTEMEAAISAAFSSGIHNGEINIEASKQRKIENSSMKAVIFGGSGNSAVQAITGIEGLQDFILAGGDYSQSSPAAPLSYKMRYIKDNSVANIILSSEYNVRDCTAATSYDILMKKIDASQAYNDDGDQIPDLYGSIKSTINGDSTTEEVLWYVHYDNVRSVQIITQDESYTKRVNIEDSAGYIEIATQIIDLDPGEGYANDELLFNRELTIYLDELEEGKEDYIYSQTTNNGTVHITISIKPTFSDSD